MRLELDRYVLRDTTPLDAREAPLFTRVPEGEARSVITRAFADARQRPALFAFVHRHLQHPRPSSDAWLSQARALVLRALSGSAPRLQLLVRIPPAPNTLPLQIPLPRREPPPATVEDTAWLELEVLYTDDTGAAGLPYRIEIPGDAPRAGSLDRHGYAYVTGLVPGSYRVTFGGGSSEAPPAPRGFLSLELVDEWGLPLAGADFVVTLPDQTRRAGTLDDNGRALLAGIPEGDCKVTFPGLDQSFVRSADG